MPEGPEAKVMASRLHERLSGKSVVSADGELAPLLQHLLPMQITSIDSYGKKVLLRLTAGEQRSWVLVCSLGMTGRWTWQREQHVRLSLSYGRVKGRLSIVEGDVHFDDSRRFGRLLLLPEGDLPLYLQDLGPDLLSREIDSENWRQRLQSRSGRRQICQALLDQSIVAGIGNYLKSEILYLSRVHPARLVCTLSHEEIERLRLTAHEVIDSAYQHGGLTIQAYLSPDQQPGTYPTKVYGRLSDCHGYQVIRSTFRDGRTSHWVSEIQHC